MSAAQGLEYIISLTDQISSPLKGVMKSIDDLSKRGEAAMKKIGLGVAGIVGAGFALKSALDPAIELNRALGEVHSLGVADTALEKLSKTALNFSSQYGESAVDFVRSSYDIQSAIAGLNGNELAEFTQTSNLLAKGTKASAATITNYMGTMYGIFAEDAAKLGNANWVNKIAGQTALAVKMFKTSGDGMSAAFTSLGAAAKAAKIDVAEQVGVLGNLQATMSGSEAGTKYKAFLAGVSGAQKELGLSFVDTNGDMLDMVTILNKIKGKFGDTLDVAQAAKLKKAFGSDQAVDLIKLLLPKTKELKNNIADITKVSDTKALAQMARSMVDPWSRLSQIITGVKTAIGGEILKKLDPIMHKVADLGQEFIDWLKTYKNIARWIGYAVGALIGFTGLTAALTLMSGIISAIGVAFSFLASPIMLVTAAIVGLGIFIYKFRDEFMQFISGFIQGFKAAGVSLDPLFNAFSLVWGALQKIGTTIGRIIGLFGGASDSAYSFQQFGIDLGYALGVVFNTVLDAVELVAQGFSFLADVFAISIGAIIDGWNTITALWDSNKPIESFLNIALELGKIFSKAFKGIVNSFIDLINFIIKKANSLPGINIPLIPKFEDGTLPAKGSKAVVDASIGAQALQMQNQVGALPAKGSKEVVDASIGAQALQMQNQVGALNPTSPKFELSEQTKPKLNSMPQGSVTKTLTQNRTEQRTINYGGLAFYGYDKNEIKQELRNKEQLAAG
ncbi:phage tail tape measure protein [Haemophilus influenzae]|uniref:Phage-related minor tail protein n=2 Tax=Bacteria TaxID=2 RepID=A0A2S9RPY2_HAEIF|nr:phage tail tape measure protein [Haemophilus influenzae]PRI94651.1 Phage-related minor tail protein [Haemophilus influenzae]PRJ61315.1 Phage-related minor tail protein [Haemophilus influenzae]PRM47596.1 Phage-related minor tail protein [Haemophilus influenzae]